MSTEPEFRKLKSLCPNIADDLLNEHISRLNAGYFDAFSEQEVCRHISDLSTLSPENPIRTVLEKDDTGLVRCTFTAFDYPFAFSLLTGILAGMGFSIQSGRAFTYAKSFRRAPAAMHRRRFSRRKVIENSLERKKIIDCFSGSAVSSLPFDVWKMEVKKRVEEIFILLEKADSYSVTRAKVLVNEQVVNFLRDESIDYKSVLYPIKIDVDNEHGPFTRMKVISEDTPFFLYTLSTAFSLHNILIKNVSIRTEHSLVEDEFDLVDNLEKKIEDPVLLSRVKLSVLLTKQFSYFLGRAPDPYTALSRFEKLVEDLAQAPGKGQTIEMLSSPDVMQNLAQVFGASDFLWEDFIRVQYEELLPLISSRAGKKVYIEPLDVVEQRLEESLKGISSWDEKIDKINQFKDREIFLIDLDHIINHITDFKILSGRLTVLAEAVIRIMMGLVYNRLAKRFGVPRTVAGFEVKFAVLGLGKFGGAALGYASDIELLFVYSDNGQTDGDRPLENSEFFNILIKERTGSIKAKREGIFNIDQRLRPYGNDGPLASSLETFCRYYGKGGAAHSYERLALVRMRAVAGDMDFGLQIERLRDEMIYSSKSIDLKELRELREKQLREKTKHGKENAKFSPGALVDLEYAVQLLQVVHGMNIPGMRTPRIHKALTELKEAGVLNEDECRGLTEAYDFLRHLINGLRMLRGTARDLFMPPAGSVEYDHLARRLGYLKKQNMEPARHLELEFGTRTAVVRFFIERHFGRDSIPGPAVGNAADLVLSQNVPEDLVSRILRGYGFENPKRAYINLKTLAGIDEKAHELFARLALLACDILNTRPDPDMALNNWERFVRSLDCPQSHYDMLLSQPMRLEILLSIFSGSQFLADTLIRNPGFFEWITLPENVQSLIERNAAENELRAILDNAADHKEWLNGLRVFKKREILRIGTRDICMQVPVQDIVLELSTLAEAVIHVALEKIFSDIAETKNIRLNAEDLSDAFCVLALGKLGGEELNYSSDIDLLGIYDDSRSADFEHSVGVSPESFFSEIIGSLRSDLSAYTEEGYAYRVDLRLRPYGRAGLLVYSMTSLEKYYRERASLWELQALLKMRPVAGNLKLGKMFLEKIQPLLLQEFKPDKVVKSIEKMRSKAIKQLSKKIKTGDDIKTGLGGIRDIEFLVQGLQLMHLHEYPELLSSNSLKALKLLKKTGLLPESISDQLSDDYIFLRRVEHVLQIYEDRQTHSLPQGQADLNALAKRILGKDADHDTFNEKLKFCQARVRKAYKKYLTG